MRDSAKIVAWVAGGALVLILLFTSYSGGHMMGGAGFGQTQGLATLGLRRLSGHS